MGEIVSYFEILNSKFTASWSVLPMLSQAIGRRLEPVGSIHNEDLRQLCMAR